MTDRLLELGSGQTNLSWEPLQTDSALFEFLNPILVQTCLAASTTGLSREFSSWQLALLPPRVLPLQDLCKLPFPLCSAPCSPPPHPQHQGYYLYPSCKGWGGDSAAECQGAVSALGCSWLLVHGSSTALPSVWHDDSIGPLFFIIGLVLRQIRPIVHSWRVQGYLKVIP